MKVIHWIIDRLKDVFYDPTNTHLDAGRLIAYSAVAMIAVALKHNMLMKLEIPIDKLGQGLAVILTALVIYVYHDRKQNGS
jgi:hypothetical protein